MSNERYSSVNGPESRKAASTDSDADLTRFFFLSSDLFSILDYGGRFVRLNDAWREQLGYEPDSLVGLPVTELVHFEDVEVVTSAIERAKSDRGGQCGCVARVRKMDGSYRYLKWRGVLEGERIYAVSTDVTNEMEAEEEQHQGRHILRSIIDHASSGIVLTDEEGVVTEWNQAQESITEISRSEALGRPIWELQLRMAGHRAPTSEEIDRARERFTELQDPGKTANSTRFMVTLGEAGRRRDIVQSIFRIRTGEGVILGSMVQDVSELKESERRYRQLAEESEEVLTLMLAENSRNVVIVLTPDLKPTYLSPSVEEMTGYKAGEFTRSFLSLLHGEDLDTVRSRIEKATTDGQEHTEFRARVRRRDGSYCWTEARARIEYGESGALETVVLNLQDITEQVEAEEALHAHAREVEELLREKELLMQEVQHRVKNIMSTMTGFLSLQAATIKENVARQALEDAASRFRSMSVLYDRLYRTDSSEALSVEEFVRALVESIIRLNAYEKRIETAIRVDPLVLDAQTLSVLGILINEVVTNSLKHAFPDADGGRITIVLRQRTEGTLLEVGDNGVGLPESVTIDASGGFGMELIEGLTEQLRGRVELQRHEGTLYRFYFPELGSYLPES